MSQATIDRLIVNSPYEEPARHWRYERSTRLFDLVEGRRPAGYVVASPDSKAFDDPGIFVEIPLANLIRPRVKAWREAGYQGVTGVTRRLLEHWNDPEEFATRRFFFCQLEAAETIIWLTEAPAAEKVGVEIPSDGGGFQRLCAKMATGSGKTVVMAMLLAWQILNKVAYPQDRRFSRHVLVVAPGLTVKSRLGVLRPAHRKNYYREFGVVPSAMLDKLRRGKVVVHNWHALTWETDQKIARKRSVDKRGAKSDEAWVREVLGEMAGARDLLIINDEAHHAWRVPAGARAGSGLTRNQIEEATKWVGSLDRMHRARGVLACYDFSATPFAPTGKTSSEEALFDWIVSDFGLNDAIEAGLVKTPRVVVRDDAVPDAKSYKSRLYHIYANPEVRDDLNRRAKPSEPLPDLVLNGYYLLGYDWRETARDWIERGSKMPPAMITVANRTETAARIKKAFETGHIRIEELCDSERMLHIDSKSLRKAESSAEPIAEIQDKSNGKLFKFTAKQRAEWLRRQVDTVGQEGQPGGRIQNVISVGMLSEGWDAKTVTHIMGLRAFSSQLLCEQVVGRGLRRTAYETNPETGRFDPEYVNVFGVPFTFLPHESQQDAIPPPPTPKTAIAVVRDRTACEIRWPDIIRINRVFRARLHLDMNKVAPLELDAAQTASIAELAPVVEGKPDMTKLETIDLDHLAREFRIQRIVFEAARDVFHQMQEEWQGNQEFLLAQLVRVIERFIQSGKITITPQLFAADELKRRLVITFNMTRVVRHIWQALRYENTEKLEPVFDPDHPIRSTGDMTTWYTGKPCEHTRRSHINLCVFDSAWEASEAFSLDRSQLVSAWAKNDHLGFEVFYLYRGVVRKYRPDFLVRLKTGDMLILEVKGQETEQDQTKRQFLEEWVAAVNCHGGFGRWSYAVSTNPGDVHDILAANFHVDRERGKQRFGSLSGELNVPEDFDRMGEDEIGRMFEGEA